MKFAGANLFGVLAFWCLITTAADLQPAILAGRPGKGAGPRMGLISRVEITTTNRSGVDWLVNAGFDLDTVKGSQVILFADTNEVAALQSLGWKMIFSPPPPKEDGTLKSLGAYNNYSNLTVMLNGYATNYPSLCRKTSMGKSAQGRELWALKITSNPDVPADKPRFKYVATMHGNEPMGTEMSLYLIDLLLKGYGSNNARIVNLMTNVEMWFLPLMNPDGRESNPPQRYNANGYDLNRSFPEGSGTNLGNQLYGPVMKTNGLQPEVAQVMAWTAAHHFSLSANFHSGSLVVNYPYDNDGLGSVFSPTPDEALAEAMSLTYSSNNAPMWNSPSFGNGIVNGAAWYAITGGMQDWNYRYDGCFDVTIELADYQWPDPSAAQIPTYWSQNRESMLSYMEWILKGVRGIVRDARTGQPVAAAVRVEGFPHLIFSNPALGDYHRILLPGTYALWFYAPGYVPQRISGVTVGSGFATRVDVAMQPVSARFSAKINFQPGTAAVPAGFMADSGAAFGPRGGGFSFGWETTLGVTNVLARFAARSQDLRYDSLAQMQAGANHTWEIAVPNGPYSLLVMAGDPAYATGTYRINAEGGPLLDGVPSASNRWVEGLGTTVVTNGRLTLSNGVGAISNRLAAIEISAMEPATIAQWRALYLGTTNNSGSAADNADPDGDSIPNLLEYALGLNPMHADYSNQLTTVIWHTNYSTWFGVSFSRNTNASDIFLHLQATTSLTNQVWQELSARTNAAGWQGSAIVSETAATNGARVLALVPQSIFNSTNHFLRLSVNTAP